MKKYCFGVDVGGTTVKMGFFDVEGNVLAKWEIPTRTENSGEKILPDIAASIDEYMKNNNYTKEDIVGVGIGVPGPVDGKGVIHNAVNLGWGQFNIEDNLDADPNFEGWTYTKDGSTFTVMREGETTYTAEAWNATFDNH